MLTRVHQPTSIDAGTGKKPAHVGRPWPSGAPDHDVDAILPVVYQELKRLARRQRQRERPDHTLNTTGLVHEAYLKLHGLQRGRWQDRAHFLALAARAMRQVLIDYAEASHAAKRGGRRQRVSLDEAMLQVERPMDQLLAIDRQLRRLEELSPRLARVVECRFFSGMSVEETALALDSSPATVKRDWQLARAWLHRELGGHRG